MRKCTYFKRYRMEVDLRCPPSGIAGPEGHGLLEGVLAGGFAWLAWRESLAHVHAEVLALSFQDELDALVFPCLSSLGGCRELMRATCDRAGFRPGATWLVAASGGAAAAGPAVECVAAIQGIIDADGHGAIQNVGVLSQYRGRGLGRALVLKALAGFAATGARRAYLEVTARNGPAVRMYRALGFRCYKTVYRGVAVPEPVAVGI